MKPTKEMVKALRSAAARLLKEGAEYSWGNSCSCNCGVLLQELKGTRSIGDDWHRLQQFVLQVDGSWSHIWSAVDILFSEEMCSVTGLSKSKLISELHEFGFEKGDFELVEFCGLGKDGHPVTDIAYADSVDTYGKAEYVSAFFHKLADELEAKMTVVIDHPSVVEEEQEQQQHVEVKK